MLCNGCYKLLRCVYVKVLLPIITMGHLRAVDDCSGLLDICQLLNREGIADNPPEADKCTGLGPPFPHHHLFEPLPRCAH